MKLENKLACHSFLLTSKAKAKYPWDRQKALKPPKSIKTANTAKFV